MSTCNCDLTANSCDVACCCDPDCAALSAATCVSNLVQTEVTEVERCMDANFLFRYRVRPGMRTYSSGSQRCFQSDNSPIRSNFRSPIDNPLATYSLDQLFSA